MTVNEFVISAKKFCFLLTYPLFFGGGRRAGPQRGGSSVKVSTKRGGPYLM